MTRAPLVAVVLLVCSCSAPRVAGPPAPDEFMRVCRPEPTNGIAIGTYDPACPPWHAVRWRHVPLTWALEAPEGCPVDGDVAEAGLRAAYGDLYDALLERRDDQVWPDVGIAACFVVAGPQAGLTAHLWVKSTPGRQRARHHALIVIADYVDADLGGVVAAHEVGHALGLDHDLTDQGSLMSPAFLSGVGPDGVHHVLLPQVLRESDRRALRGLYLRGRP